MSKQVSVIENICSRSPADSYLGSLHSSLTDASSVSSQILSRLCLLQQCRKITAWSLKCLNC